jgi:hypothetical protein
MAEVMERRTAMCCGCEDKLTEDGTGTWCDPSGSPACIPAQFGRPPVPHMPLPEGFRGAPA